MIRAKLIFQEVSLLDRPRLIGPNASTWLSRHIGVARQTNSDYTSCHGYWPCLASAVPIALVATGHDHGSLPQIIQTLWGWKEKVGALHLMVIIKCYIRAQIRGVILKIYGSNGGPFQVVYTTPWQHLNHRYRKIVYFRRPETDENRSKSVENRPTE
jgi:hypothetical protein